MDKSRFTLIVPEGFDRARLTGLLDSVDPAILMSEDTNELLPTDKHLGPCRICGQIAELTKEHLPPQNAFNKQRGVVSMGDELFKDGLLTEPSGGTLIQGGLSGYMLCESCNNFTGRKFGREYQEWVGRAAASISWIHNNQRTLEELDSLHGHNPVDATFREVYPGRFVRQVISMMLCLSGGPELGDRYPDLRELTLGGEPRALPNPLKIYLEFYVGPSVRFAGGQHGQGIIRDEEIRWILQLAFPPLSLLMILDGPPDPSFGCDITSFTECDLALQCDIEFTELIIGFGHSSAPADFRTRGLIDAQD